MKICTLRSFPGLPWLCGAISFLSLGLSAGASPARPIDPRPAQQINLEPGGRRHFTPAAPGSLIPAGFAPSVAPTAPVVMQLPELSMAPTRSSFLASWQPVASASSYRIDVSTDPWFDTYVPGYKDLDVGNVISRIICGLQPATRYYYRIRVQGPSLMTTAAVSSAETASDSGLVIDPTFDSSITSSPNAAAIESAINRAIAIYQSLFSDPVTVEILYRYSTTLPDGTAIPPGAIAVSNYVVYGIPWSSYLGALRADARTTNDSSANANLPPVPLTENLVPSSAGGRSIGLDTPPAMFADGSVSVGGPYDGIVTLNSGEPYQFTRPPGSTNFDAQRATEHEMDEVLGLGSYLGGGPENIDFRPEDLFSWSSPGIRNHAVVRIRYFSIDDGFTDIVDFNQVHDMDFGDWASEPCPQAHPYVQNAFGCKGQSSDIAAGSPEGIALDVVGYDLVAAIPPDVTVLGNISTRSFVGTGEQVLIGGFIIAGTQSKEVILRAIGPSLPLGGALSDPYLELHDSSGAIIASNDNWRTSQETEILNTGVAPTLDAESAIVKTLEPGAYTVIVKGAHGETGVGLVEAYDLDQSVDSRLANISTRSLVQTGDNVLIGGFIILGQSPANTILRAIGPSLPVAGPLVDPILELHDSNGTTIMSNDDWQTDQEAEIIATGIAPTDPAEAAIVATLPPAPYTAIVRGKDDSTGLALVEVYQIND
jgi:hypothetical protein